MAAGSVWGMPHIALGESASAFLQSAAPLQLRTHQRPRLSQRGAFALRYRLRGYPLDTVATPRVA